MQVSIVRRVAVAVFAATFVATAAPAVAAEGNDHAGPANFDARADDAPARIPAATKRARAALETALGEDADVRIEPSTGAVTYVGSPVDLLTGPAKGDAATIILDYVREHGDVFGLGKADVAALQVVARSTSPDGITHVRFNQVLDGIESFDSGIEGHVAANGALINVSGGAVPGATLPATKPKLGAVASLGEARDAVDGSGIPSAVETTAGGAARETTFTSGETARLRWLATADGPQLVWQVIVDGADSAMFSTLVGATDGDVLARSSLSHDAGQARFSKLDPDHAAGLTTLEMPTSWYDQHDNGTRLWGQFARTYDDSGNRNPAPGFEDGNPQIDSSNGDPANPDWLFTRAPVTNPGGACPTSGCSWDHTVASSAANNLDQAGTNVHVLVSRFHDYLAAGPIGFDEASGNFQRTNTSGAGRGNDYVRVEVNDGAGTNNANMSTPPDGNAPRMQMYLWSKGGWAAARDVNGSDAADIVYHEYGHGISNRLVVNASGTSTVDTWHAAMMGEAWSDFYALDLIVGEGSMTDTAAPGEIALAPHVLSSPNGIRNQAIDCPVGVTGVPRCTGMSTTGGYTFGRLANAGYQEHNGGEIWSQTLWDIRTQLGREPALALVTGGMRLSPDHPSMLDMRNAILQQAAAMRSAPSASDDYVARLWSIFAVRGFGWSATGSANTISVTQKFDLPPSVKFRTSRAIVSDPYPFGDADGVVEPGEQFNVDAQAHAIGVGAVTGISGSLATTSPTLVDIVRGSATWPNLAAGDTRRAGTPMVAACAPGAAPRPPR